ncbi:uncharacterized protein LOC124997839 [Mugil cephalus]|uniref:uncharacterized protein LOC124997839 n=1 Tax=Mugil cephalus TaxID=48193 RepID=UPI001FB5FAC3|nr:uncharacterized protein LOC124997839 [Mugil cephalus]
MAAKRTNAMNQTPYSPQEPTTVDVIHHVVNSYIGMIDPRQWAFLLTGAPDGKTRYILVELLIDLVELINQSSLSEEKRRGAKPWEFLSSGLGETIPQTFPQILVVPDEVFHEILDSLRSILIRVATAAYVKCMHFVRTPPATPCGQYNTALKALFEEMVDRIIEKLCSEKKRLMSKHQRLHLGLVATSKPTLPKEEDLESNKPGVCNNDIPESLEMPPEPLPKKSPPVTAQTPDVTDVGPEDTSVPPDTASVSTSEPEDTSVPPDTASVSTSEHEDNSVPAQTPDVTDVAPEDTSVPPDTASVSTSEPEDTSVPPDTASVSTSEPEDTSVKAQTPDVTDVTPEDTFVPPDTASVSTSEPEDTSVPADTASVSTSEHEDKSVPVQTPNVTDVTPEDTSVPPDTASVSTSEPEDKQDVRAEEKSFVSGAAEKLISRALKKSKVTSATDSLDDIHQRIFTKLWEGVESEGLHINQDQMKNIDKAVFKDVCKNLHCSKSSLWTLMVLEDPPVEDVVLSSFKNQMKRQSQEPGPIKKFFRSIGRAFCRPTVLVS